MSATNAERAEALLRRASDELPDEILAESNAALEAQLEAIKRGEWATEVPVRDLEVEQRDTRALAGVYATLAVLDELKAQRPQQGAVNVPAKGTEAAAVVDRLDVQIKNIRRDPFRVEIDTEQLLADLTLAREFIYRHRETLDWISGR